MAEQAGLGGTAVELESGTGNGELDAGGTGAASGREAAAGAAGGEGALPPHLAGTPFKTEAELAAGFKNLQRQLSAKDNEYKANQRQTAELIRSLTGVLMGKSGASVTKEDADTFLKRFLGDPHATLAASTKQIVQQEVEAMMGSTRTELHQLKQDRAIDTFLSGPGKDLSTQEQERFLQILEENPWIGSTPDPLKTALNMLISEDLDGFQSRRSAAKDAAGADLKSAKAGASGLGGKRSSVGQQGGNVQRDEFDDVLDRYRSLSDSDSGLKRLKTQL